MAVAFVIAAHTSGTSVTSLETGSFSTSGSNPFIYANASGSAGSPATASAIKLNGSGGTSFTLDPTNNGTYATYGHNALGWLVSFTVGSVTVYASWGSSQDEAAICACQYSGVDQVTPMGTIAYAEGSGSTGVSDTVTSTVDVSTTSGDLVVDATVSYHVNGDGFTPTEGAGQTSRAEEEIAGGFTTVVNSEETATGATTTMSWQFQSGGSTNFGYGWAAHAFVINPAAAAGGVFIPIVGRGPGMALAGRGGLAG